MKTAVYVFDLAWPPSVNHTWRKAGGRVFLDPKVRAFRMDTLSRMAALRRRGILPERGRPLDGTLAVRIVAHPPDNRRRDLDNLCKAVLDALTHAGVWNDDAQVKRLESVFGAPEKNGRAAVEITTEEVGLCPPSMVASEARNNVGCGVKFERIRRITGYLVGKVERFNNAKRAEVRDRVGHQLAAAGDGK